MKRRLLLLPLLLPVCAMAGLDLVQVDRGTERPAAALVDAGTAPLGEPLDLRFRVRNTGPAAETVRTLTVTGSGFQLQGYPTLPYVVAPGAALDFTVRFAPPGAGYYTASIQYNTVAVLLRGSGVAAALLVANLETGPALLSPGTELDFGKVERGAWVERTFTLENRGTRPVEVSKATVRGTAFQGPLDLQFPLEVAPGRSVPFRIGFQPSTVGLAQGELEVDGRVFLLRGTGLVIPPPRPALEVSLPHLASAEQGMLVVRLASPSRVSIAGEVHMEFRSAVPVGATDKSIGFLPTGSRVALFRITEGDSEAYFGGRDSVTFQTGTTAGVLVFNIRLGDHFDELILPIPAEPVKLDLARGFRSGTRLEVHMAGFDNARSASQLSFTFYDRAGAPVPPGTQRIDVTSDFLRYFESASAGGAFLLRAVFPTTGKAAEIAEAEVEILNSAGTTRTERIRFE